jgi:inosine/xanthosine triphosphatase
MNPSALVVGVGSRNRIKIEAARRGVQAVWPAVKLTIVSCGVTLDVSEQPLSLDAMESGSCQRAEQALEIAQPKPDFGIGIEGGAYPRNDLWMAGGCVTIFDQSYTVAVATTQFFELPDCWAELLDRGQNLNQLSSAAFGVEDLGSHQGMYSLFTNGAITLTDLYAAAVTAALTRFVQPELYRPIA